CRRLNLQAPTGSRPMQRSEQCAVRSNDVDVHLDAQDLPVTAQLEGIVEFDRPRRIAGKRRGRQIEAEPKARPRISMVSVLPPVSLIRKAGEHAPGQADGSTADERASFPILSRIECVE